MWKRLTVPMVLALFWPVSALGQIAVDITGARAMGMGGAFVAVANDATAVHWNPAGLIAGGPAGMTFGWDRFQTGKSDTAPVAGSRRDDVRLTSLGTWPLGISYGRFRTTSFQAGADDSLQSRTLTTSQFGVTVLQSVAEGLIAGSTVRVLRGTAASGPVQGTSLGDAFSNAVGLAGKTRTTIDLDVGVMATSDNFRIGLVLKNLREPSFTDLAGNAIVLKRRARLGVAALPSPGLSFALDVDLDTADREGGLRRMIAFGGESRLGARSAARAGVRWSRDGDKRPEGSVGASLLVRRGLWLDGYVMQGRRGEGQGFGVAMRAGS